MTLCLLIWWSGFFFGHHKSERTEIVSIDDDGNVLVQKMG